MKKLLTLVMAVVLMLSISVVASAADATELYDFSALSGESKATETAGWWVPDAANDHTLSFADGKVSFGTDAAGRWSAFPSFDETAQTATKGAAGWGIYVKGAADGPQSVALSFNGVDTKNYIMAVGEQYALVDMDGNVVNEDTVETPFGAQGGVVIPADFEGYVYIPFGMYFLNGGTDAFDAAGGVATPIYALGVEVVDLTIGEFFAWSGELPQESADNNDDEQESTADVSVIAYAAAAIAGLGALVVAKKR